MWKIFHLSKLLAAYNQKFQIWVIMVVEESLISVTLLLEGLDRDDRHFQNRLK